VGTRNALAISKIALAALAKMDGDKLADVRLGAASLADRPVRCSAAECALLGKPLGAKDIDATVRAGRAALASETHTIDDIRSTAKYRAAVAGNLLEEFLRSLASQGGQ
jgi:putative cofactor-binding repeat protein